jgi:DNA-binding NarL/FixJ family response regulator
MDAVRIVDPAIARFWRSGLPTILVIDDDPLIADVITAIVPSEWSVLAALDGLAGLDIVRQRVSDQQPLDLVILDIELPGMDGFDTCILLRAVAPQVAIIPFTHLRDDRRILPYMTELACAPPLYKGVGPQVLRQSIQAALAQAIAVPAQPPSAVFERLLEKAAEAEVRARATGDVRVGLFATDMIERLGVHQLLVMADGIAVVAVEAERAMAGDIFRQGQVDVLMAPAVDEQAVCELSQTTGIPALLLARTLKDAHILAPRIRDQRDGPALGLVVLDDAFARTCVDIARTLLQGTSFVDPRLEDSRQELIESIVAAHIFAELSPRLVEVVLLDLLGLSSADICARLQITQGSLKMYWSRIYKQQALDRAALRVWARGRIADHPQLWMEFRRLRAE